MKMKQAPRRGAMLMMIVLVVVILLVAAVFSVDVAQMHMVRAELRTATDAAARAGTEVLTRTQDPELAIDAAIALAERNAVAGNGLSLRRSDIEVGSQTQDQNGRFQFVANRTPLTSVRVVGTRDARSLDGPAPLLFANIFGVSEFKPSQTATASASVRDVALVLDQSGSMNARSGGSSRLAALQKAVREFIAEIKASSPHSRVSLTAYSTRAARIIPLTENYDSVLDRVNRFRARGATNIFQALQLGSDSLEQDPGRRPFAAKTVIVMTDGNFNVGGTPIPSARVAAGRNQTIHTITFSRGANQRIMRDVANIGNGLHIHADDSQDLTEAFREIARTLSVFLTE